jgi:hypothetical protein
MALIRLEDMVGHFSMVLTNFGTKDVFNQKI